MKKYLVPIIIALVLFLTGFFLARCTTKSETISTEYIQLPPIHHTVTNIEIKYKEVPTKLDTASLVDYLYFSGRLDYLKLHDTTVLNAEVDTTAIIKEFITKNYYSIELFNIDTLGKCSIDAEVQFNELADLCYTYTPVQKVVTKTNRPSLNFLIGGGLGVSTDMSSKFREIMIDADAGVLIKGHYQLQYMFQYGTTRDMTHNIIFSYVF